MTRVHPLIAWTRRRRVAGAVIGVLVFACTCAPSAVWSQTVDNTSVKTAATELLEQYTKALESLDADAVKKVQPSVDATTLRNAFRQMRSLEVEIDTIAVLSATPETARVSCRVKQTLEPRAGSKQTTTVTRVLRLKREQDAWLIDAFER